ncbi:MAG: histidinol-phosphate transaminase [Candidatus Woesebacteria bacterium]|jgi:histidinol-phosphate aminotransferase
MKSQLPQPNSYIKQIATYKTGLSTGELASMLNKPLDQIVRLAANENPHGPSPKVQEVIRNYAKDMSRYPEVHVLQKGIANYLKVDPRSVIVGNGSCEILEIIARAFLQVGDDSIFPEQSFVVYKLASQYMGANCISIKSKPGYADDLDGMLAAITPKTRVMWLANINNPTGNFTSYKEVKKFIKSIPSRIVIVLDEAYFEYLDPKEVEDSLQWIYEFPNLIVTRTFSKVYGLAGLRIGYGVGAPVIIDSLQQMRGPYNCNNMSVIAALKSLEDKDYVNLSRKANSEGLKQITKGLDRIGYKYLPTKGNFVSVNVGNASKVAKALINEGIVVLPLNGYNMPEYIRVSVGLKSENSKLLEGLLKIKSTKDFTL